MQWTVRLILMAPSARLSAKTGLRFLLCGLGIMFGAVSGGAQLPASHFIGCWELGYRFAAADTTPTLAWFHLGPVVRLDTVAGGRRMSVAEGASRGPFRYMSWTRERDSLNLSFRAGRTGYSMRLGVTADSLSGTAWYASDVLDAPRRADPASARRVDCNAPVRAELKPDSSLNPGVRLVGGDSIRAGYPVDPTSYVGSRPRLVGSDARLEPPYDGANEVSIEMRAGVVHRIEISYPSSLRYDEIRRKFTAFHGEPQGPNSGPEHSFGLRIWNTFVTNIALFTSSLASGSTMVIITSGPP